ncbi:hypothetical protein KP509_1Z169500 [Ceratopteris richardii]|nr:hypothetical protein KP509_1Z169500 [Ceratopteris richardii]
MGSGGLITVAHGLDIYERQRQEKEPQSPRSSKGRRVLLSALLLLLHSCKSSSAWWEGWRSLGRVLSCLKGSSASSPLGISTSSSAHCYCCNPYAFFVTGMFAKMISSSTQLSLFYQFSFMSSIPTDPEN